MAHIPGDIQALMYKQGWNDDTLLELAFDFLNIADEAEAFYGYCTVVARDENEQSYDADQAAREALGR